MNTDFTIEEIEAYVEGKLDQNRAKALELAAQTNKALAKNIQLQKAAQAAIIKDSLKEALLKTKAQLQAEDFFEESHQKLSKEKPKPKVIPLYLKLAAAAALITGISFLVFFLIPKGSSDLMAEHFEPFEDFLSEDIALVIESRSDNEQPGLLRLEKAMKAYNNKDYKTATQLFEQHFRANPLMLEASKIKLYMGISQLGAEQYQKAELSFETLAQRKDYEYVDAANWYLALCEIKLEKKEEAKAHLQKVLESKAFGEQAKKLLQQL
jgi:TolA-binding protein